MLLDCPDDTEKNSTIFHCFPLPLSLEQVYGILLFQVLSAEIEISLATQEVGELCSSW